MTITKADVDYDYDYDEVYEYDEDEEDYVLDYYYYTYYTYVMFNVESTTDNPTIHIYDTSGNDITSSGSELSKSAKRRLGYSSYDYVYVFETVGGEDEDYDEDYYEEIERIVATETTTVTGSYKVTLTLLYTKDTSADWQRLLLVNTGSGSSEVTSSDTYEIEAQCYLKITITKKGGSGEALDGVGFRIYDNTVGSFINTSGYCDYENSTVYTDNGEITISAFKTTSGEHDISVREVSIGDNEYYVADTTQYDRQTITLSVKSNRKII